MRDWALFNPPAEFPWEEEEDVEEHVEEGFPYTIQGTEKAPEAAARCA